MSDSLCKMIKEGKTKGYFIALKTPHGSILSVSSKVNRTKNIASGDKIARSALAQNEMGAGK